MKQFEMLHHGVYQSPNMLLAWNSVKNSTTLGFWGVGSTTQYASASSSQGTPEKRGPHSLLQITI